MASIYETLSAVQADIAVPKNHTNKFGGYNYRNAEDIMEAAKTACKAHEASFFVSDDIEHIGERFYVVATVTFCADGNTITSKGYAREQDSKKGMDEAQITGAASSYARKYALCGMFGIDGQDDPDAMDNRTSNQQKKPRNKTNDLSKSKQRLARAINAYCSLSGQDANVLKREVPSMTGYNADDPQFFNEIASSYEQAFVDLKNEQYQQGLTDAVMESEHGDYGDR